MNRQTSRLLGVLMMTGCMCACNDAVNQGDTPVVKVFDKVLFRSEVAAFTPAGQSKDDSLIMSESYVRNWITKELMLRKAINNLSNEERDIQKQVEDYRVSLLIHRYKQKLIAQKLETQVTEEDIEKYYHDNKDNFILPTPVVKAIFFIVPKSASNLDNVRRWFRSDRPQDQESLEEYCITNARKYDKFDGKWVELKYILNLVPGDVATLEREIPYMKYVEKEDDENYYFLRIKDIRREQTLAPLEYVTEEITLILRNRLKLEFENELDSQINEEGRRRDYVKLF